MKAPILPKKFDKQSVLKELNLSLQKNPKNDPFINVTSKNNRENIKAKNYIENIETFQQVRFDLLYQENEKMLMESRFYCFL